MLPQLAPWKRSSKCISGSCVEVRRIDTDTVGLRDIKQLDLSGAQPMVLVSGNQFVSFFAEMHAGLALRRDAEICVIKLEGGDTVFRSRSTGVELRFDQDEIDAFVARIRAGEFTPEALMQPVS